MVAAITRLSFPTVARIALVVVVAGVVALALGPGDGRSTAVPKTVVVGEFFYAPGTMEVRAGQKVRFVNRGRLDHAVAAASGSGTIPRTAITPKLLSAGESRLVTLTETGTVIYVCTLHPTRMKGCVVVIR